jgi:TM2 domain-containing membrane protein YozV
MSDKPAGAEKKIICGVFGILLGYLGIHKFILGYTTEGIIMLVVSIVGGVLTCGIAVSVIWIIGLIEGIIYLTKTDEDFINTYITNKRTWF